VQCADLKISKTADAQSVSVGSNIGFTVAIANSGSGVASGVDVNDPLPAGQGVSWQIATSTGPLTCAINGSAPTQTLSCGGTLQPHGDAAGNDAQSVHVFSTTQWTDDPAQNSCGNYANTASLTWQFGPADARSASASESVLCPELTLTKTADVDSVNAGDPIGFTVEVTNAGPGMATGAVVNDPLPGRPGVDWTVDSVSGTDAGNCAVSGAVGSQVLDCTLGALTPDADVAVHVVSATTGASCGTYDNTATLTTANTPAETAKASTSVSCAHLSVVKTADAPTVSVGSDIGFTITARNDGAGVASGVLVSDPLPTGPGISWTLDGATGPLSCGISSGTLTCTGTLLPSAQEVLHVTSPTSWTEGKAGDVNSCTGGDDGTYDNTAQVSATNVVDAAQDSAQTRVLCPDLDVRKTADAAAVNAGTPIGFTIKAYNEGPGDATGVRLTDRLPTGPGIAWTIDSAHTDGPLACSIANGTLTCTGALAAGMTENVHITSPTAFQSCATYRNAATLTAGNTPQSASDDAHTQVLCADVVIHKTADAETVDVGSSLGFTVTVTNNGAGTASGVQVDDPLPAGDGISWQLDSNSGPLTCSINGSAPNQSLDCTGTLQAKGDAGGNDVETVHVTSGTQWTSDPALNSCGTYDNTATVVWNFGPDTAISSNTASETVQCPNLTLTKTADAASVSAGDSIGFVVDVTNTGAGTANGVVIDDPLPSGPDVTWTIASVNGADQSACAIDDSNGTQALSCNLGDLGPQADVAVHVVSSTTAASCGTYENTATLTTTNVPGSQASASTSVLCPELTLAKAADADAVDADDAIGFTVTAHNDGPGAGRGVTIDDPLPAGTGVSWSADSGPANCVVTGSAPNQTLSCSAVDLNPGDTETVHVTSATAFASCATYANTATLTATNAAPLTASARTTVRCPSLTLTKTADAASVDAGAAIGFTITAQNGGPGVAHDATINDPLPAGTGVSWSLDSVVGATFGDCSIGGSTGSQVLACSLGDLATGADVAVHVVSRTTDTSCARYANTATLTASNAPEVHATASTRVTTCLGVASQHHHRTHQAPPPTGPTAFTGVPMLGQEILWGVLLIGAGGLLMIATTRRRHEED
jgi:uncharacterized repeat protein (TIGR01451 family)